MLDGNEGWPAVSTFPMRVRLKVDQNQTCSFKKSSWEMVSMVFGAQHTAALALLPLSAPSSSLSECQCSTGSLLSAPVSSALSACGGGSSSAEPPGHCSAMAKGAPSKNEPVWVAGRSSLRDVDICPSSFTGDGKYYPS